MSAHRNASDLQERLGTEAENGAVDQHVEHVDHSVDAIAIKIAKLGVTLQEPLNRAKNLLVWNGGVERGGVSTEQPAAWREVDIAEIAHQAKHVGEQRRLRCQQRL